ncbi:hypothetical protein [Nocardia sp. NPDC052566]|uniref:hypothetical protein n=1 Tax=Nocardia sp. NPDC052566 TaxID=3364330 RepID=UPI0037CB1C6C
MIVLSAAVVGCADPAVTSPPTRPPCVLEAGFTPASDPDLCSVEQVLRAAIERIFAYQPSHHVDQRVAFGAALALMDPEFAAAAEPAAPAVSPITRHLWQQWATDGVTVHARARVTADDHPVDTSTHASRVLAVSLTPSDGAVIAFTVYATVTRSLPSAPWLMSGMRVLG